MCRWAGTTVAGFSLLELTRAVVSQSSRVGGAVLPRAAAGWRGARRRSTRSCTALFLARSEAIKRARSSPCAAPATDNTCDYRLRGLERRLDRVREQRSATIRPSATRTSELIVSADGWPGGSITSNRKAYSFRPATQRRGQRHHGVLRPPRLGACAGHHHQPHRPAARRTARRGRQAFTVLERIAVMHRRMHGHIRAALACSSARAASRSSKCSSRLLVMAVGIIGIAALYSDQVQTNPDARLHAARPPSWRNRSRNVFAQTTEGREGFATTIGVLCEQQTKPALPQDIAAREAACWEDEVERKLPSGLGTITPRRTHDSSDLRDRGELVGAGGGHGVVCDPGDAVGVRLKPDLQCAQVRCRSGFSLTPAAPESAARAAD